MGTLVVNRLCHCVSSVQNESELTRISSLNPQPSALNPQPSTLNPQPSTRNPKPETLKRKRARERAREREWQRERERERARERERNGNENGHSRDLTIFLSFSINSKNVHYRKSRKSMKFIADRRCAAI